MAFGKWRHRLGAVAMVTAMGSAQSGARMTMIKTGVFHGLEMPSVSSRGWLGLQRTSKGFEWRHYGISVRPAVDIVSDEPGGQMTGKEVIVAGNPKPLFLLKGFPSNLGRHPVTTTYSGSASDKFEPLEIANPVDLGSNRRLFVDGKSRLHLEDGNVRQILSEPAKGFDLDRSYELKWAGDLDGDGRLDLFVVIGDYNSLDYVLFLSTRRGPWSLVGEAARLRVTGC